MPIGMKPYTAIIIAFIAGALLGWMVRYVDNALSSNDRDRRLEERFLDECQWAPQVAQLPDGSVPARVARNPYPLCFLELQKAKNMTTTVQLVAPPQPTSPPPETVSPKK